MSRVTLAISVYNAERFIEQTFLSALNQSYLDIEYIIVDDCGTDDSIAILEKIVQTHPRGGDVRILKHELNKGVGATRNTAIDNATGRYIFFMDNDDLITENCIELLYSKISETPVDFVAGSFVWCTDQGELIRETRLEDKLIVSGCTSVAAYRYMYGHELYVQAWNKLYDMNFIRANNIRCVPRHYNEDPWLTYQIVISATSCRLLAECTYKYTIHSDSITSRNKIGYSDAVCRQYIEIQKLKGNYIRSLRSDKIYPSLVYDIAFMSFYHGYRMFTVGRMTTERRDLIRAILRRDFAFPSKVGFNKQYLKFVILYLLFSLPVGLKYHFLRMLTKIKLKDMVKWRLHF